MLDKRDIRLDLMALGLLAVAVFLAISLATHDPADPLTNASSEMPSWLTADPTVFPPNEHPHNACGQAGAIVADISLRAIGWGSYYVTFSAALLATWMLMRRPLPAGGLRFAGWLASLVAGVTLVAMFLPNASAGVVIGPGGYLGALGRTVLESHFATMGSLILLGSAIVAGLLLCTDYLLVHLVMLTSVLLLNALSTHASFRGAAIRNWIPSMSRRQQPLRARRPLAKSSASSTDVDAEVNAEASDEEETVSIRIRGKRNESAAFGELNATDNDQDAYEDEEEDSDDVDSDEYDGDEEDELDDADEEAEDDVDGETESGDVAAAVRAPASSQIRVRKSSEGADRQEVIAKLNEASVGHEERDYQLPPLELLKESDEFSFDEQKKEVRRKAEILEKTFKDFNLDVRVVEIETGPVIAQYEVELKRGLRLSKITGLADDLAIALRVPSVRIVAPIPGKNTVGIEVPNDQRQTVRMREVMQESFGKLKKMRIPLFLGKDVSGNPLTVDLTTMPHLLIAGRTGTGKSVCLNSIISSILMTRRPDEVRMLMIDPKMVELSGYATLPHLMHPVVTDMRKAEAILAWAVDKMEERYALLARVGVRHVSVYNQLGEEELMDRLQPENDDDRKMIPLHLPFIVIVADEIADLMMTAGKEVEQHIIRLAQKSRAVGIHLILATQKPTVDVITGLIKSNLPARIAFQVASRTDSRVVLDEMGADKLLGSGDMLLLWPGTSTLLRGQGTYMDDDEINRIVEFVSTGEQDFVQELVRIKVEKPADDSGGGESKGSKDDLFDQAVEIIVREGRGSVSLLQRHLQIGYGRAARLIDFMAEDGIVGTYNGSQAREVLMTLADWETRHGGANTVVPVKDEAPLPTPKPRPIRLAPPSRDTADEGSGDAESAWAAAATVSRKNSIRIHERDQKFDDDQLSDEDQDDDAYDDANEDVESNRAADLEEPEEGDGDVSDYREEEEEEEYDDDMEDEEEDNEEAEDEEYEEEDFGDELLDEVEDDVADDQLEYEDETIESHEQAGAPAVGATGESAGSSGDQPGVDESEYEDVAAESAMYDELESAVVARAKVLDADELDEDDEDIDEIDLRRDAAVRRPQRPAVRVRKTPPSKSTK